MDDKEENASHTSDVVNEAETTDWQTIFDSSSAEEILGELHKVEAFIVDGGKWSVSASLNAALNALVDVISADKSIGNKRIKSICDALFGHFDLYILFLKRIIPRIQELSGNAAKWNVYRCIRHIPLPTSQLSSSFFNVQGTTLKPGVKNTKLKRWYQDAWLALLRLELPKPLLKQLVPYLGDRVLSALRDASLVGDFLFRVFKLGDVFSILSLSAIFKLVVHHNLRSPARRQSLHLINVSAPSAARVPSEYPNFYECVYGLTTPSVCYLSYRERFFTLLDTFLSSTHLASYIVAAFVKRLSRIALLAPLACQQPLLGLIRNLLTRHDGVRVLLHRDNPATFESDPYNVDETRLKECGALESSLWEIKTLQRHWFGEVAKRARFVDKGVQRVESFVRWKSDEEFMISLMATRFGSELQEHAQEEKFKKAQTEGSEDESDDNEDEGPKRKKARRAARKQNNEPVIPLNTNQPDANFFHETFLFNVKDYCVF